MPDIAVLNDKIITVDDIYKFNIEKTSNFLCYNCDKPLHFRQSRNAENNYTEHFFHPNTIKNTHIECETNALERIREQDTWHNKLSGYVEQENREVIRRNELVKHIVDVYDPENDMGIEFQNSPISVEAVQSRDSLTHLDWIFNVENQYIRKVKIGNRIVCEIPHENWENAVKAVKNSVYLYTGCKEWIYLDTKESYRIEIENLKRHVWIGRPCSFQQIHDATILQNVLTPDGLSFFENISKEIPVVNIVYARCKKSMFLLDTIHRNYLKRHIFQPNDILAIKSVAGSGKTTTLLELAKRHTDKKILYLAFNKALITEIQKKIKEQQIKNLIPLTFDKLLYEMYIARFKSEPSISDLTPQTIKNYIPWFKGKPFELRKRFADLYSMFCSNYKWHEPEEFCKATLRNKINLKTEISMLTTLWSKSLSHELISFESLRKLAVLQHWFKNTIDTRYDMIFIDETQDFDMMMLRMLIDDTTIPKVFVGDPLQSIYEWRGCINGFNYLPKSALVVEFYSTFRVGDPACEQIRTKFDNCWMISKSKNETLLSSDIKCLGDENYTYLFRTWRHLLLTAATMKDVWICNYDSQKEKMKKLHTILTCYGGNFDDDSFSDDLPQFLRSLSESELNSLIDQIEDNLVEKSESKYKFYTIHAYKGLEDENIRIANDLEDLEGKKDENLYYVALTRGMKKIIEG